MTPIDVADAFNSNRRKPVSRLCQLSVYTCIVSARVRLVAIGDNGRRGSSGEAISGGNRLAVKAL